MSAGDGSGTRDLQRLRREAAGCTACRLYHDATQTVFGRGSPRADLLLVGEQPGDREDLAGEPFVGPAGRVLDRALEEAGVDPGGVFTTNVVKHFKFTRRGKRRIHQKPRRDEIDACLPWLRAEIEAVTPSMVVALGATAAKTLISSSVSVTRQHGEIFERDGLRLTATLHPSAILRAPDERRDEMMAQLVEDLRAAAAGPSG